MTRPGRYDLYLDHPLDLSLDRDILIRESLPPVSDSAHYYYNSVKDTVNNDVIPAVEPFADSLGKTIKDDVAPTLKEAFKTSLNAVFTGVPKVISQVCVILQGKPFRI